jgi:hypothetical protein
MRESGSKASPNRADDKCKLDSRWERIVHDTIVAAGLTHKTHPPLNDGKGGLSDFLVNGVYVEVWGLDDPEYNLRRSEKLKFYLSSNLALVEFEPADFEGKARAIRAKVQEIVKKVRVSQDRLKGTEVPEMRDLRLDELLIAETLARENGDLIELDRSLEESRTHVESAKAALQEAGDREKDLQAQRHEIIRRWIS